MALVRWQPFREMATIDDMFNRLFDERYFRPYRWSEEAVLSVPLDVYEEDGNYVAEATLPGVKASGVEVQVHGDTVTISGTLAAGEGEKRQYLLRERRSGKFSRTLTLPAELNADKVEATFTDGVLRIVLPKAEQYLPKKIAIKSAS
jgi:HSP20 family protein